MLSVYDIRRNEINDTYLHRKVGLEMKTNFPQHLVITEMFTLIRDTEIIYCF